MKRILDVLTLGSQPPPQFDDAQGQHRLRLIPTGTNAFSELPESTVATRLTDGDGELVALVADTGADTLRRAELLARGLTAEFCAAATTNPVGDLTAVVEEGALECFGRSKSGIRSVVFRRSAFKEVGPLRPIADPVWDWLIRAARAGKKVDAVSGPDRKAMHAERGPMLVPHRPDRRLGWLKEHLASLSFPELGIQSRSPLDETALRAGLFQWHDFLDESHHLSQSIEGRGENQLGDYWHAIMHRREPDYTNAKYWFRQICPHPLFGELRHQADSLLERCRAPDASRWRARLQPGSRWDPFAFVDLCEACAADEASELAVTARRIQFAEMSLLMNLSYAQAQRS